MKTRLYLLKARDTFTGYVRAQNYVIRAVDEKAAREMADCKDCCRGDWISGEYASCEELLPDGPEEIVIEDNNGS